MALIVKKATGNNVVPDTRKWIGIAPFQVLGLNPNKKQIEDINKIHKGNFIIPKEEPTYSSVNDEGIQQLKFEFYCKTDKNIVGIELFKIVSFTVKNNVNIGKVSGKYQIIDIYGQTAWATEEEVNANKIPMYSSGPSQISNQYKKMLQGELELTNFVRALKQIPNCRAWQNDKYEMLPENKLDDCIWIFTEEELQEMFKLGTVTKDFRQEIALAKTNKVWMPMIISIKTKDDGTIQEFNNVSTQHIISDIRTNPDGTVYPMNINKVLSDMSKAYERNKNENTTQIYETCLLKEYKHSPTAESFLIPTEEDIENVTTTENVSDDDLPF